MIHPLGFDALKDILHHRIAQLPDHRKQGPNTQYAIQDAALGAFGIFFTQSASFLEYQRRLQHTNDVLLHSGAETLSVNWCDLMVVNATTGEQLYHNSWITNHRLTADTVVNIAHAGRGRWKIENENNNVLKTKGYHLEHNFGHGKQYLAAFLLSLNL